MAMNEPNESNKRRAMLTGDKLTKTELIAAIEKWLGLRADEVQPGYGSAAIEFRTLTGARLLRFELNPRGDGGWFIKQEFGADLRGMPDGARSSSAPVQSPRQRTNINEHGFICE